MVWDVVSKRPRAVWKGHDASVLEVKGFDRGPAGLELFTYVLGLEDISGLWLTHLTGMVEIIS